MTSKSKARNQRGAALIITVVVIMILSTLGLAMVAFTLTEERTASTYRDTLQTRALAEGGVRLVQQMFRTPGDRDLVPLYSSVAAADGSGWDYWGATDAAIETELNQKGIYRKPRAAATPAFYSGNTNRLFVPPFGTTWAQTFGGTYSPIPADDIYDLKFNCTNPTTGVEVTPANCWLETNFNFLLTTAVSGDATGWSKDSGKITDISFYGPPTVNGRSYGIATVRVTAEKYDTRDVLLARETIVALIGDNNISPSMMGDGDINTGNVRGCGDGCEQIHANGTITTGGSFTGGDPVLTYTTPPAPGGGASKKTGNVVAPIINPWDLVYKPTASAELDKYYLLAARQLDAVWTNADPLDNPAPRVCGLAMCQDYNLEYTVAGAAKAARSATGNAYLYRWDEPKKGWTQVDDAINGVDNQLTNGTLNFIVTRAADLTPGGGAGDTNAIPFNKDRVPRFAFDLQAHEEGATVLIDGMLTKSGGGEFFRFTMIAVGSATFTGATRTLAPAMGNKTLLISGRDLSFHSSVNNDSHNNCNDDVYTAAEAAGSGIIAAHEQLESDSQTSFNGIVLAENRVTMDTTVSLGAGKAIQMKSGDHAYRCGFPDYPWVRPTVPEIFSMTTAAN